MTVVLSRVIKWGFGNDSSATVDAAVGDSVLQLSSVTAALSINVELSSRHNVEKWHTISDLCVANKPKQAFKKI